MDEATEKPQGATDMLNIKVVSWALGIFTAISFVQIGRAHV